MTDTLLSAVLPIFALAAIGFGLGRAEIFILALRRGKLEAHGGRPGLRPGETCKYITPVRFIKITPAVAEHSSA